MAFTSPERQRLFWRGFMVATLGGPVGVIGMLLIASFLERDLPTNTLALSSGFFFLGMSASLGGLIVLLSACWVQHRINVRERDERTRAAESLLNSVTQPSEN